MSGKQNENYVSKFNYNTENIEKIRDELNKVEGIPGAEMYEVKGKELKTKKNERKVKFNRLKNKNKKQGASLIQIIQAVRKEPEIVQIEAEIKSIFNKLKEIKGQMEKDDTWNTFEHLKKKRKKELISKLNPFGSFDVKAINVSNIVFPENPFDDEVDNYGLILFQSFIRNNVHKKFKLMPHFNNPEILDFLKIDKIVEYSVKIKAI